MRRIVFSVDEIVGCLGFVGQGDVDLTRHP